VCLHGVGRDNFRLFIDVYKNLLGDGEFHENRHSESHTLLTVINEFIHVLCTVISDFGEI
jgi:hypothetical protein